MVPPGRAAQAYSLSNGADSLGAAEALPDSLTARFIYIDDRDQGLGGALGSYSNTVRAAQSGLSRCTATCSSLRTNTRKCHSTAP